MLIYHGMLKSLLPVLILKSYSLLPKVAHAELKLEAWTRIFACVFAYLNVLCTALVDHDSGICTGSGTIDSGSCL